MFVAYFIYLSAELFAGTLPANLEILKKQLSTKVLRVEIVSHVNSLVTCFQ